MLLRTLVCAILTLAIGAAQHGKGGKREAYENGRVPYQSERFDFTGSWEIPWHRGTATLTLDKNIKYHHWYYPEGSGTFVDPSGHKFDVKWRVPNTDSWEDYKLVFYVIGLDHDSPFGRQDMRFEAYMVTPGNNDYMGGTFQWRERVNGLVAKRKSPPQKEGRIIPPPDERPKTTSN